MTVGTVVLQVGRDATVHKVEPGVDARLAERRLGGVGLEVLGLGQQALLHVLERGGVAVGVAVEGAQAAAAKASGVVAPYLASER